MKCRGNTLGEYGLMGALLAVAGLAAFLFFGGNLNGWLDGFKNQINQNITASETQRANRLNQPPPLAPGGGSGTRITLRLSDGTEIVLENYPANLAESIVTSGANGTTDLLLANLEALIRKLHDEGKITEEQANALRNLANQGHRISEIERLIGGGMAELQAGDDPRNSHVTFEGQEYNLYDLGRMLGWSGREANDPDRASHAGREQRAFQDLLADAEASGSLSDPAVRALVQDIANKIMIMSDSVEGVTGSVTHRGTDPAEFVNKTAERSDRYAADICTVGNGQDSGIHCG